MNQMTLRACACALCLAACIPAVSVAIEPCPTRTPAPTPTALPAEIVNSSAWLKPGDPFQSTFQLNEAISRQFTAFAVVVLPDGTMLNALTLDTPPKPVAANVPGLNAPFSYPLIKMFLPDGAPLGGYEVLAAFFDPKKPITGTGDAFLLARGPFTIATAMPTPTPSPILDISGAWTGMYLVTAPTPCAGRGGMWAACVIMGNDGTLSGHFETTTGTPVGGAISGTYDGATATWTVGGTAGLTYTGTVQSGGETLSGTFSNGALCDGTPTSGSFIGIIE
ncbi:MAG: hypothetical protein WCP22_04400 [Chlamydiota bacterium]